MVCFARVRRENLKKALNSRFQRKRLLVEIINIMLSWNDKVSLVRSDISRLCKYLNWITAAVIFLSFATFS